MSPKDPSSPQPSPYPGPEDPVPSARRRGAPAGNLNALKHGFYSKIFRQAELEQVSAISIQDVTAEIELLRLIIKRTVECSEQAQDFDAHLRFLGVLAHATAQLRRLLTLQDTFRRAESNRQSAQEDVEYFNRLMDSYRHSSMDPYRHPSAARPAARPAAEPPAPPQAEQLELDHPHPSPSGDEVDQTQELQDDKFWPHFIDD